MIQLGSLESEIRHPPLPACNWCGFLGEDAYFTISESKTSNRCTVWERLMDTAF